MSDDTTGAETAPEPRPGFAREASDLLASGDVRGALALARAGAERYPWYPTGFLTLAECQEASGEISAALVALRAALRLLPDAPVLHEMIRRLETGPSPLAQADLSGPPAETPEPPVAAPEQPVDVGTLAERLREVKRIVPEEPSSQPGPEPREPELRPPGDVSPHLVSATLAEIYVQQHQYQEAIGAYRTLIERQPEDRGKYETRIEEIKELIRKDLGGADAQEDDVPGGMPDA